jgi:hypothetical protein
MPFIQCTRVTTFLTLGVVLEALVSLVITAFTNYPKKARSIYNVGAICGAIGKGLSICPYLFDVVGSATFAH